MTRHQVETELSDIRREILRLQRREAALITRAEKIAHAPRPGWPMHRVPAGVLQASGAISSTSAPSRTAV